MSWIYFYLRFQFPYSFWDLQPSQVLCSDHKNEQGIVLTYFTNTYEAKIKGEVETREIWLVERLGRALPSWEYFHFDIRTERSGRERQVRKVCFVVLNFFWRRGGGGGFASLAFKLWMNKSFSDFLEPSYGCRDRNVRTYDWNCCYKMLRFWNQACHIFGILAFSSIWSYPSLLKSVSKILQLWKDGSSSEVENACFDFEPRCYEKCSAVLVHVTPVHLPRLIRFFLKWQIKSFKTAGSFRFQSCLRIQ